MVALKRSGADIFFDDAIPKFAAQAIILLVPELAGFSYGRGHKRPLVRPADRNTLF
jgi:hypothetical protein